MPIPPIHNRRSIRLAGYDYSQAGMYFVTLVSQNRECLFGKILDSEIEINAFGRIVMDIWNWLSSQYPYVELDQCCIMPNHFHGIIVINDTRRGGSRTAPTQPSTLSKPLGRLIGAFKTVSTKQINNLRQTPGLVVWQRNYYEHIIRNEKELNRIRQYIIDNPANWVKDEENSLL
jgi:putative transposase